MSFLFSETEREEYERLLKGKKVFFFNFLKFNDCCYLVI